MPMYNVDVVDVKKKGYSIRLVSMVTESSP